MKKIVSFILSFSIILTPILSFANSIPVWSNSAMLETISKLDNKVQLDLDAEGALLMDETTGTILYAKNEHEKLRPASVTKVMTLLLIMEAIDSGRISLTDTVSCSSKASKMGGSQIWLDETENLTVDEMLKAICVVSANDCSVAMSEFIARKRRSFCRNDEYKSQRIRYERYRF